MAFLDETDFCSAEIYARHRDERILEGDLQTGELYTYMMLVPSHEQGAASQTVRLENKKLMSGLTLVRFAFLDDNLMVNSRFDESIRNGLVVEFGGEGVFLDEPTGSYFKIEEAYLRDYFDLHFGEVMRELGAVDLAAAGQP